MVPPSMPAWRGDTGTLPSAGRPPSAHGTDVRRGVTGSDCDGGSGAGGAAARQWEVGAQAQTMPSAAGAEAMQCMRQGGRGSRRTPYLLHVSRQRRVEGQRLPGPPLHLLRAVLLL